MRCPTIKQYLAVNPSLLRLRKHRSSTMLIRPRVAKEHPVRDTALVPKKKPFRSKHESLAPLIRTQTSRAVRKPNAMEEVKAPLIRTRTSRAVHKPNTLEGEKVRKITLSFNEPEKEVKAPFRKPNALEGEKVRKIRLFFDEPALIRKHITRAARKPNALEGEKVRKITLSFNEPEKEVIPRKVIDDTLDWKPVLRDATEVSSEVRGEDETSSDEVTSWLDELDGLVSQNTPGVTTKTGFSQSSPHSLPRYSAKPPASSWKPILTRQSLEYSKLSFSTWSRKAAKRCYAIAAVSKH